MYHAPKLDVRRLADALVQWFQSRQFESHALDAPEGGALVQTRQEEGWRAWLGLSQALNIQLIPAGDNLTVQIGAGKWVDKAVVGAAGALLFWPLLIPAAYGAWKQSQLPREVFAFIEQYIATGGEMPIPIAVSPGQPSPVGSITCPSCGHRERAGAKFCTNCGAKLERVCASCGHPLPPEAKFCDNCGAPV